jgi:tetratricopeptide (TPR) repeat protein
MENEDTAAASESTVPETEAAEASSDDLPDWLGGLAEEESNAPVATSSGDDLPAWMRDDTGELVAEPTKIEPTRSTDWTPVKPKDEEGAAVEASTPAALTAAPEPEPAVEPKVEPAPTPEPVSKKPEPQKMEEVKPATPREPYKEPVTRKTTGMLEMPVDPILGSARAELNRSNIPGALETYGKLIKKGRFLEEVIYDLRDALYRYPVEVSIWQSLGDAYMRANQLQDALDAYTKAEELLR